MNGIFVRFRYNGIEANSGKSYFLVSPYEKISLKILGSTVDSSPCEGLLGITIDSELTFHKHIISSVPYPAIFFGSRFFGEISEEKNRFAAGESGGGVGGGGAISSPQWDPGMNPSKIFAIMHSE